MLKFNHKTDWTFHALKFCFTDVLDFGTVAKSNKTFTNTENHIVCIYQTATHDHCTRASILSWAQSFGVDALCMEVDQFRRLVHKVGSSKQLVLEEFQEASQRGIPVSDEAVETRCQCESKLNCKKLFRVSLSVACGRNQIKVLSCEGEHYQCTLNVFSFAICI